MIRLVLASMPPLALRNIIEEIAGQQSDMEVVARDVDRSDLRDVVREHQANVVVVGLESNELPEVCTALLREFPDTLAVGVASDGRFTAFHALHVNNIGANELMETIRTAARRPKKSVRNAGVHGQDLRRTP